MTRATLRRIAAAWPTPPAPCSCFLRDRNTSGPIEVVDPHCPTHGDTTP
jgi:hypothetical protein